jgi:Protein of unknown function (DUF2794)
LGISVTRWLTPPRLDKPADWGNHDDAMTGGGMVAEEPQQNGSGLLLDFPPARPGPANPPPRPAPPAVSFERAELQTILNLYGKKVAEGEWRDYAIDFLRDRALFSIFRRSSERPLYVVEKNPKLRHKQGQYMVLGQDGRVLKRGQELSKVLRVLELALVK